MLRSVTLLWKRAFHVGKSVSVLVCVTHPLPVLPNCISAPRVASWQKTCVFISVMEAAKEGASSIKRRGRVKKNTLQYFEFGPKYLVQRLSWAPLTLLLSVTIFKHNKTYTCFFFLSPEIETEENYNNLLCTARPYTQLTWDKMCAFACFMNHCVHVR